MKTLVPVVGLLFAGVGFGQMPGGGPGYGGPVILGRGPGVGARQTSSLVQLRPFVQLNGIYDTGLLAFTIRPDGTLPEDAAYGVQALFGVNGYHSWRRTVLGVDYRGDLNHYSRKTYYDGFNNFLALQLSHQATRHTTISLSQSLASYTTGFFLPTFGSNFYDPSFGDVTGNDLFNNRTTALMSTGSVVYQKSARLSFGAQGTGFVIKRRTRALIGVRGYGAAGNIAYRVSRYQTIGVDYIYNHYGFSHYYNIADMHGVAFNYSVQIGRYLTIGLRAGGFRLEALGLQQVPADPVIAAILGQSYLVSAFHRVLYVPNYTAEVNRRFRRSSLSGRYGKTVSPGNGVYMTSGGETIDVGYHYSGLQQASFGVNAGTTKYRPLTQQLGNYRSYMAGVNGSYRLAHNVSLTARFDARRYGLGGVGFSRISYRATVGVAYAPGELPFSLW